MQPPLGLEPPSQALALTLPGAASAFLWPLDHSMPRAGPWASFFFSLLSLGARVLSHDVKRDLRPHYAPANLTSTGAPDPGGPRL